MDGTVWHQVALERGSVIKMKPFLLCFQLGLSWYLVQVLQESALASLLGSKIFTMESCLWMVASWSCERD